MSSRAPFAALRFWAGTLWVTLLALLLVTGTAQSAAPLLSALQTQPGLSAFQPTESKAILVTIGKVQRAPDAGLAGKAVPLPLPAAVRPEPLPLRAGVWPEAQPLGGLGGADRRPEPRAPPTT